MVIRCLLAALVLAFTLPVASAQTPTPAQMEMLRQLPPDQQAQLLQQFRSQNGQPRVDPPLEMPAGEGRDSGNGTARDEDRTQLPARKPIIDPATGLPLFGYDLFAGAPSTFAPVTDIPVPVDYVLGPGDQLHVQLLGKVPGVHVLVVNRDGAVNFPELGPIIVAGLSFDEARRMLQERVSQQMIGVTASITMGELRSIRIFVLGDAQRPGSYTVSSLSTITNALFASGGVKPIGSLRNIQLKRNGERVTTLDLYDLLLRGDTRADARLSPGDVIFIPPVGTQVGVDGEVRRPGVYELRGETTAAELVQLGGGLSATAFPQGASLARINEYQERTVEDVNLKAAEGRAHRLRPGDLLNVPSVLERVNNAVTLSGHVYRPLKLQFRPGMRISDLLPSLDALKPLADASYVLIRREMAPDRQIVALSADLVRALEARGSEADVLLQPRDKVTVFSLLALGDEARAEEDRANPDQVEWALDGQKRAEQRGIALKADRRTVVDELLDELRLQASLDSAAPVVRVDGRVRAAGLYPLEPDMRVSDLLRAGGRLSESAFALTAEVTRYEVIDGQYREAALISVDLAAIRAGDPSADIALQPHDFLNVKEVTHWREQESVTLRGEVRFPGTYPIRKDETLLSVLARAGGMTDRAYTNGAIFTREELREREARQLRELSQRMEADLAALALQQSQAEGNPQAAEAIAVGRGLLSDLNSATPVGRLAMDFNRVLAAEQGSEDDIILEDGDVLMVPGPMQSVTVVGEVQSPTSILFDRALARDDYINLSGGMTRRADVSRVYIVRANGQVTADGSRKWFRSSDAKVQPGDTIVVPTDIERMRPLPLWSAVTSIIFNLAVAVAAVNSF